MLTKGELLQSAAFAAKDIAEEAFIYGLPIVMNYGVMYEFAVDSESGQFKAPFNQIKHEANVFTYKDTAVPTPNSDTPYSILFMDLRAEPIILSVPEVDPKRYYSVMLCDGDTYNYGYIGTRATGSAAGDYMVVGPDWKGETPAGVKKVFRSGTQFSAAAFRTQLFGPDDLDNVKKVQAGYRAQTLSEYLNRPAPPPAPTLNFPKYGRDLSRLEFFEYLDFALQFAPAQANQTEIRAKLARIGVGPGKTFDFKDLPSEQKAEILMGMKEGSRKVDEAITNGGANVNGWRISGLFGDSAHYNGDWLKRAAAARAGLYGNSPQEAMYPMTRWDSDGDPLDGDKHNYTLTFPAGQLPPVNTFWSLTIYDGKTQLLIENPINRYLINSPMLPGMKTNSEGSLTIFIQNKSPGGENEANWLPAPEGPIYLVLRLYWPKTEPPSLLPPGSGAWQPPGVQKVS